MQEHLRRRRDGLDGQHRHNLENLPAFLLAAIAVGILLVGPRRLLGTPQVWAGAGIALALWAPSLLWQAAHGWPQLEISREIAAGSSGTSQPRAVFVPFQLVLVSPVLAPVWLVGLWRLVRDPELRTVRCLGVAYAVLVVSFVVTGGKPYYLGGMFPLLLAAGSEPTLHWAGRGRAGLRRGLLVAAVALGAAVNAVLMLPVLPVTALGSTPVVAVNYDAGETVGWPAFARTVADAYDSLPPQERRHTALLTGNYGEAGALDHYGPALGLPSAYSGHNSYGEWGPPPATDTTTIAVGITPERLAAVFGSVEPVGTVDNGVGVDNDEQGRTVWLCRDQRVPWSTAWPWLRHLG